VCKLTTDAIIAEGSEVGTVHKVCANPTCPVHHPKPQTNRDETKFVVSGPLGAIDTTLGATARHSERSGMLPWQRWKSLAEGIGDLA
jgi:hypothetical protein